MTVQVAVFGASGFVGSAVCETLEERGHEVLRLKAPRFAPVEFEDVGGRLKETRLDPAVIEQLRGVDVVVNAAGDPGATSGDSAGFNAANGLTPFAIARGCLTAEVPRFIHISSSTVQGDLEPLDDSDRFQAFSPYSASKIFGEKLLGLLPAGLVTTYRPPAVHAASRRVSQMIAQFARSPLASYAADAAKGTPQALLANVAAAVGFLSEHPGELPSVVHHPWEGLTPQSLLELLGNKKPVALPGFLVKPGVRALKVLGKASPWLAAQARRAELLWLGQTQAPSWLTTQGFELSEGKDQWRELGQEVSLDREENSKPRALIFTSHDVMIYNSRKEIVEALLEEGWEVLLAYPGGDRVQYFTDRGALYKEISYDRHGRSPVGDLRLLGRYVSTIRDFRPDIVLTFTVKPNVYGGIAARILDVPFVANVTGVGSSVAGGGWLQSVVTTLQKLSLRQAKKVFFQNAENLALFEKLGIVGDNASLLPGSGVNLEEFALAPYPEDGEKLRLLYLGRIQRDKGIEELAEAASQLWNKGAPVEFHVAGFRDGPEIELFERLVEESVIKYYGNVDDVRPLLREAHALIQPSHHEGMSNVLLEAAAMGRPVLASDIPGCREAVDEGQTGFTFPAGDAAALKAAVEQLLALDNAGRARMGEHGRQKVADVFDRRQVVRAYLAAIV